MSLFLRFTRYGNKLSNSEEVKKDYKKRLDIQKRVKEISEIELRMWYEDSVFRRVSGIEYSEHLARTKYELFLEKDEKYISATPVIKPAQNHKETSGKDPDNDDDIDNSPLFTIKFKK